MNNSNNMDGQNDKIKIENSIDDVIWESGCLIRSIASIFQISMPEAIYLRRDQIIKEVEGQFSNDESGEMDWTKFMEGFTDDELKRIRDLQDDPDCPEVVKSAKFSIEKCSNSQEVRNLIEKSKGVMVVIPPSFLGTAHTAHIIFKDGLFIAISDEEAWDIDFENFESYFIVVN